MHHLNVTNVWCLNVTNVLHDAIISPIRVRHVWILCSIMWVILSILEAPKVVANHYNSIYKANIFLPHPKYHTCESRSRSSDQLCVWPCELHFGLLIFFLFLVRKFVSPWFALKLARRIKVSWCHTMQRKLLLVGRLCHKVFHAIYATTRWTCREVV